MCYLKVLEIIHKIKNFKQNNGCNPFKVSLCAPLPCSQCCCYFHISLGKSHSDHLNLCNFTIGSKLVQRQTALLCRGSSVMMRARSEATTQRKKQNQSLKLKKLQSPSPNATQQVRNAGKSRFFEVFFSTLTVLIHSP